MVVPTHEHPLGNVEEDGDPAGQHVTGRCSENRAAEGVGIELGDMSVKPRAASHPVGEEQREEWRREPEER